MKISSRRDYLGSLESVAMTDIVLNMFIFFFISFSLLYTFNPYRIQKLKVKLPEAASTTTVKETKASHDITITNEGVLYLDKSMVTKKELKERIRNLQNKNPGIIITVQADRLVRFKDVVGVIDILTELNISNLNIAAASE